MTSRTQRRSAGNVGIFIGAIVVSVIALSPIAWVGYLSIAPPDALGQFPPRFTNLGVSSYAFVLLETPFMRYLRNSLIAGLASASTSVLLGFLAAYSFSRFRFRGAMALMFLVLFLYAVPTIAMILGFFVVFDRLNLIDTVLGLSIAHVLLSLPLCTWLLRGFIIRVPVEIEEAAYIDGCSRWQMLIRILLPLTGPGIASAAILSFLLSWNDFLNALILTGTQSRTLPVLLTGFITERVIYWDRMAAAGMLVMIIPVIFGLIVQRHLSGGLVSGGVKGA